MIIHGEYEQCNNYNNMIKCNNDNDNDSNHNIVNVNSSNDK